MKRCTLAASLAAAMAVGTAASAATIQNGGFEEPGTFSGGFTTIGAGSSYLTGWSIDYGSVDLINTFWQNSEGDYSLDLDGSAVSAISQEIGGLTIGQAYTVLFDLAGNPQGRPTVKSLEVMAGADIGLYTFDTSTTSLVDMGWVTESFTFTATATTETLTFSSTTGGNFYGPALDNIRFQDAAPVPLPASLPLLGVALIGMGALARRRKG